MFVDQRKTESKVFFLQSIPESAGLRFSVHSDFALFNGNRKDRLGTRGKKNRNKLFQHFFLNKVSTGID